MVGVWYFEVWAAGTFLLLLIVENEGGAACYDVAKQKDDLVDD